MPKVWLAAMACAFLLMACIGDQAVVDGGGTETGNGTVQGLLAYEGGRPAVGARITVRRVDYLALPTGAGSESGGMAAEPVPGTVAEGKADGDGHFVCKGLKAGLYLAEAQDGSGQGTVMGFNLADDSAHAMVFGDMRRTATVTGRLLLPGGAAAVGWVQVYGLEHATGTDSLGRFAMAGMPEGRFDLRFTAHVAGSGGMDVPKVNVSAGVALNLGDYELPPKGCEDLGCDTLTVKALLAAAGFGQLGWSQVATTGTGLNARPRVVALDLKGLGLTVLPDGVGQLSALRKLDLSSNGLAALPASLGHLRALRSLDVYGNRLSDLPENLGALRALNSLVLRANRLKALPVSLSRLTALELLDIQDNLLTDLPVSFTALGPLVLAVDGNALCGLENPVKEWVLAQDPAFDVKNQTCTP